MAGPQIVPLTWRRARGLRDGGFLADARCAVYRPGRGEETGRRRFLPSFAGTGGQSGADRARAGLRPTGARHAARAGTTDYRAALRRYRCGRAASALSCPRRGNRDELFAGTSWRRRSATGARLGGSNSVGGREMRAGVLVNAAGAWADEVACWRARARSASARIAAPWRNCAPIPRRPLPCRWCSISRVEFYFKPGKRQASGSARTTRRPACHAMPRRKNWTLPRQSTGSKRWSTGGCCGGTQMGRPAQLRA